MSLKCLKCSEIFDKKSNYDEHIKFCQIVPKIMCNSCKNFKQLVTKYNCSSCLSFLPQCKTCKRCIVQTNGSQCNSCIKKNLKRKQIGDDGANLKRIKQIGGRRPISSIFESKYFSNTNTNFSLHQFLNLHNSDINNYIVFSAIARGGIKFSSTISIEFIKIRDSEEIKTDGHFTTSQKIILPNYNFDFLEFAYNDFETKMERFTSNGSDWAFNKVHVLSIDLANYTPTSFLM